MCTSANIVAFSAGIRMCTFTSQLDIKFPQQHRQLALKRDQDKLDAEAEEEEEEEEEDGEVMPGYSDHSVDS